MGDWLGVNWRPSRPSCEVPGPDNGCVTVCPLCNAIWSVDHAQSGFPKKRRCNTGSFNSLLYRKRRLSLPKVRAYGGYPGSFTSRFFIKPPPEADEPWTWCFSFWEPKAVLATVPARSDPRPAHHLGSTCRQW